MSHDIDQEKISYLRQLRLQLEDWRTGVDLLKAKADRTVAMTKKRYDSEIEALVNKYTVTESKLKGLQRANEHHWNDLKSGVDQALQEMRDALDKAHSRFK